MTSGNVGEPGRRWLLLGLGLSVLFNVGFAAAFVVRLVGFPPPPPPPVGGPPGISEPGPETGEVPAGGPARMRERLGLTEEQAQVFHEDRKAMATRIRELRARVREEKAELFHMVATDAADIAALKERTARIAGLQKEVQDIVVEHLLKMRGKLDAAQKGKFDEFIGTEMCGCPMCDGGCLGGRMGPGRHGQHRGGPGGPGGPGGCGEGTCGGGAGQGEGAGPGGGAGSAPGECGCGGSLGGVIDE